MPGYWTLTATRSPSRVTARCTCPIEAAANASCSNSAKCSLSGPPSSDRTSFSSFDHGSGGTSSRSVASVRLNCSRSASGMAVNSTVESTWPIFIAAPRMRPSCSTSSRAKAAARSPVAASARSGERTRFAARVPAQRRPWPATRPPTAPVRARREVGGASAIRQPYGRSNPPTMGDTPTALCVQADRARGEEHGVSHYGERLMRYTREVSDAIEAGRPVVALESTIIAHGLPRPENLEVARAIEEVVREEGATPATIADRRGDGADRARPRGARGDRHRATTSSSAARATWRW